MDIRGSEGNSGGGDGGAMIATGDGREDLNLMKMNSKGGKPVGDRLGGWTNRDPLQQKHEHKQLH